MRKLIIINFIVLILAFTLNGCSVYKIDVQQGNTLEADKIAKLKLGMSKQQVNFLLGTALVRDPFHQNRWDYVYSFTAGGSEMNKQHITLFFEKDKLTKIDKSKFTGYVRPKNRPFIQE